MCERPIPPPLLSKPLGADKPSAAAAVDCKFHKS